MEDGSPFLHRFEHRGSTYYFHSLTMDILEDSLAAPSAAREKEILSSLKVKAGRDRGLVMGTLFLTTRCPRKCSYCFLRGVPHGDMTTGEVETALKMLDPGADLLIYGGEPLLRPDLVSLVVERSAERNLSIATGGLLPEPWLAKALALADAFVIVSIDGQEEVQDRLRPYPGRSSFREAIKAFRAFRDAGCRVGVSVTVTRGNVNRMPGDFIALMERLEPDDMGLNPWMHPLKGGRPCPGQISAEEALQAVTACMDSALEKGMYVEQLARRVRPFIRRTPRLKDCASAGGRLVAVPGGSMGACDCMTVCGDHGVPLGDSDGLSGLLGSLRELSPVNFQGCMDCPALLLCGGGCRYDALHASGKLSGVRSERCRYEVMFLRWMLARSLDGGRESLVPAGGFRKEAMPMPVGTMLGEEG